MKTPNSPIEFQNNMHLRIYFRSNMSTNTEQVQPVVETPAASTVSNETENVVSEPTTKEDSTVVQPQPVVEEPKSSASSWFTNLSMPTNLTSQLNNLSSSFMQVTSKVSAAANTLVQKTLPQRPSTPTENEQAEGETKPEEKQEEPPTTVQNDSGEPAGINADLSSTYARDQLTSIDYCSI